MTANQSYTSNFNVNTGILIELIQRQLEIKMQT